MTSVTTLGAFSEVPHFVTRGNPCFHSFLLQRCRAYEREIGFLSDFSMEFRAPFWNQAADAVIEVSTK